MGEQRSVNSPVMQNTIPSLRLSKEVTIPIVANGDIDSPERALSVLNYTQADAVMVGRSALGRPWLFNQIRTFLESGLASSAPSNELRKKGILQHLKEIHLFYGESLGVKYARKHLKWYWQHWQKDNFSSVQPVPESMKIKLSKAKTTEFTQQQLDLVEELFSSDWPSSKIAPAKNLSMTGLIHAAA